MHPFINILNRKWNALRRCAYLVEEVVEELDAAVEVEIQCRLELRVTEGVLVALVAPGGVVGGDEVRHAHELGVEVQEHFQVDLVALLFVGLGRLFRVLAPGAVVAVVVVVLDDREEPGPEELVLGPLLAGVSGDPAIVRVVDGGAQNGVHGGVVLEQDELL